MSYYIQLDFDLTEDLGVRSVGIAYNDTGMPSDSILIKRIAIATLKALSMNSEDVQLQDILNGLNITKP